MTTLSYRALFHATEKVRNRQKPLTRDFAPYCFSTFSRSCLKQASKRSWKGLSASVTFSPWMRTPSARFGIWRGEQKCEKPSSDIPRRDEMHYPYIQFNSRDLWPLWLCTLSTISECTSVCVHEKGNIPATLPRWKQTILEKAVAMTLPPSASHRQHQHIIT